MLIYCIRHGHAELMPNEKGIRPLTKQGIYEVGKVAKFMANHHIHVSHIMYSKEKRARDTANILAQAVASNKNLEETETLNPEKTVALMIDQIQCWNNDTILVGHMPYMSQLVSALVLGDEDSNIVRFTPATVVCLERYEHGHWIVKWVISPEML